MLLRSENIADRLAEGLTEDPLVVVPSPNLEELRKAGAAAIDLRLGTWIVTPRQTRVALLSIAEGGKPGETGTSANQPGIVKDHYVPFGGTFILHPRNFILAATLEWLRLPADLGGYVMARSSWGRRGLIIATASGVHPGFAGCLTLELTNVGEIPIEMRPGMAICQLFLHSVKAGKPVDRSRFLGLRKPVLGTITPDAIAKALSGLGSH